MTSVNLNQTNDITAVILAAGKGTRFNGHKMMHNISGIPMAIRSALNAQVHVKNLVVIVRPQDSTLKQALNTHQLPYIENPDFENGLSSSIVAAINHVHEDQNILLCLGDMPFISSDTYGQLIENFKENGSDKIVRPVFLSDESSTIPAHPVLFPASFQQALKQLSGDEGAKSILKTHKLVLVKTSDEGVIRDIDYV